MLVYFYFQPVSIDCMPDFQRFLFASLMDASEFCTTDSIVQPTDSHAKPTTGDDGLNLIELDQKYSHTNEHLWGTMVNTGRYH